MTPYDLPTYEIEKDFKIRDFLTDPLDHGSWVAMCLARTYIMSNAPRVAQGVFQEHSSNSFVDGISIGWKKEPTNLEYIRNNFRDLGWGNPEPTHLVYLEGRSPSDVFMQLRADGVDEIGCFFLLQEGLVEFPGKARLYRPGLREIEACDKGMKDKTVPRFVGGMGVPPLPSEVMQMIGACAERTLEHRINNLERTMSDTLSTLHRIAQKLGANEI